ncbi:MAG TPA: response regulator [Myxococcales bacterium]|jgi:CheY-like chemotaxis protein|nr:response regulator [Myxococcales bacterium]
MKSFLLVDDNLAFAENLAEILRDAGHEVLIATNGEAALRAAEKERFDALVTDMRMPVMGGASLVHEIRRGDADLPAIVVTAYSGEEDLAAARNEGLLAVLPKPVPVDRLLELLELARRDALVALVEDDAALADNLCEALRDHGFSTVTARSISDAQKFGEVKPFVALVDRRVPGGPDGEAMNLLARRFPHLPQIVITAFADGLTEDGVTVFTKPFDTATLLQTVGRLHQERGGA